MLQLLNDAVSKHSGKNFSNGIKGNKSSIPGKDIWLMQAEHQALCSGLLPRMTNGGFFFTSWKEKKLLKPGIDRAGYSQASQ